MNRLVSILSLHLTDDCATMMVNSCSIRITPTLMSVLSSEIMFGVDFELVFAFNTSANWQGKFKDAESPGNLSAFNIKVYGTAKGTMTVSWDGSNPIA